ncbi:carboxymuconolactone decarboxylase family protein [Dyadobacter chenwenxiniae]|uniref:Carboxymuconolactone decarboxylase family protein n=1 Tax=Dyadobacter chenwenxiniae TaxID=2906456 RepID=A0A9X1TDN5_9BACT|nr:carboxymuconolactone decarboxylase family protein [Dyadobacter chenwenxiniae]MCF0060550.1 carboxymuconolactone decarboxylase family protein [Dyadobacter chenwenxiniae]UON86281.1 carboxymuconolactone decarboxylase family protein [Dyadobacter chenwenxiniae]
MENRLNMQAVQPEAYKAMYALEGFLRNSELTKVHKELIKMRASQINHCAFCLDMHSKDALKSGETVERLVLLNAWKETSLFTAEEKIILALTEAVTLIHNDGIPTELYRQAEETFGQQYLAQVIMAIVTINGWNRIAISTHMQPGS